MVEIIRKKNPSLRKDINTLTLKKVESFLKEQVEPVFRSEIVNQIGVDYNSLNIALQMLDIKKEGDGRIYLNKK